jgi:hypothetical protein
LDRRLNTRNKNRFIGCAERGVCDSGNVSSRRLHNIFIALARRVHRARPTSAAKVCVFNQLRLSVRSHCFTSILHSREVKTHLEVVLLRVRCTYLLYCIYSLRGGSHEIACNIKKTSGRSWNWAMTERPHNGNGKKACNLTLLCVRSAIPNFRRKSCDFIRGSELASAYSTGTSSL